MPINQRLEGVLGLLVGMPQGKHELVFGAAEPAQDDAQLVAKRGDAACVGVLKQDASTYIPVNETGAMRVCGLVHGRFDRGRAQGQTERRAK